MEAVRLSRKLAGVRGGTIGFRARSLQRRRHVADVRSVKEEALMTVVGVAFDATLVVEFVKRGRSFSGNRQISLEKTKAVPLSLELIILRGAGKYTLVL